MKRFLLQSLKNWKRKKDRLPLILKGVPKVGKTSLLKEFGLANYRTVHYLSFKQTKKAAAFFRGKFDPVRFLTDLSFLLNSQIDVSLDLVILDDIDACPEALLNLTHFKEQLPALSLIVAGAFLNEGALPTDAVEWLTLAPLCFAEFLAAVGDEKSLTLLNECNAASVIAETDHAHLWQQLKIYWVTGGLPEVVQLYLDHQKDLRLALTLAREKQLALIQSYYADIPKYAGRVNASHIDRVLHAIPLQLIETENDSAKRFQFKGIVQGLDRYQAFAKVFAWLKVAGFILPVSILEEATLPLSTHAKASHFKAYLFDVGILGALADIPIKAILDCDAETYPGYLAQNFIAQEFTARGMRELYSWQNGRTEIEFLYTEGTTVLPIEVKSGWVTRSLALLKYAEKYKPLFKTVFNGKPYRIDAAKTHHQCSIYMAYWFPL